jgi:structure-specific recognition protein 1
MATAQFENIYHGLAPTSGSEFLLLFFLVLARRVERAHSLTRARPPAELRIAPSGLGWKSSDENEAVVTVPGSDIKWIQWHRVARNYQMRIGTNKKRQTFDGFLKDDFERLGNLCKQYYNISLETKDVSVRGWNWGVAEVQADDLAFLVAGKPAFTIPLNLVQNTSINKAEVALEFASALPPPPADGNEDPVARKKRLRAMPDEVSEMRLYIPGSARGMKKKGEKAKAKAKAAGDGGPKRESDEEEEEEDEDDEDEGEDGEGAAQAFHDAVKEKAAIGQISGEAICTFPEVLCTTPRGRFGASPPSQVVFLIGTNAETTYRQTSTSTKSLCAFAARRTTTASRTLKCSDCSSSRNRTTSTRNSSSTLTRPSDKVRPGTRTWSCSLPRTRSWNSTSTSTSESGARARVSDKRSDRVRFRC